MLGELSIRKHPIETVVDVAATLVPGAVSLSGVYYTEHGQIVCKTNYIQTGICNPSEFDNIVIGKLASSKLNKLWISPSQTGIAIASNKGKIKQLSLEDEFDNNTLVLKFPSISPEKWDLVFIELNKDKNNFEIESKSKALNTESKGLIAHLLFNTIKSQIDLHHRNYTALQQIVSMNQNAQAQLNTSNYALKELQAKHQDLLRGLIEGYAIEFTKGSSCNVEFTDEALELLSAFEGQQSELKNAVAKAVQIAINLSINDQAIVYPTYLQFESYQKKESTPVVETRVNMEEVTFNRYAKTIALLDRYEKAARESLRSGLSLTGKNVGQHCSPAISAPAITDSIKKHKNKIITLLSQHPEKWSVIRNEFKPILNILPNSPQIGNLLIGA